MKIEAGLIDIREFSERNINTPVSASFSPA
jgi:hypothetical protein